MDSLKKGQKHTVKINGYASDGSGVCRAGGRAVFVKGALDSEIWDIKILKVSSSAVYARGENLKSASPERRSPACPHFKSCGGCDLLHMSYEEELRFKLGRVNDAFAHIAGLDLTASEIIGAETRASYRNKAIYAVASINGRAERGYFRARSHELVPVSRCMIQPELFDLAADAVLRWMRQNEIPAYNESDGKGSVRHIYFRRSLSPPGAVCCVVSARGFGGGGNASLVSTLREACPELTGIVLNINKSGSNTVLSGDFHTLWGSDKIEESLCGLRFELSPMSFFQINPVQAEKLYDLAVKFAEPEGRTVLDLYCGAGTISLCLARSAALVVGAETVEEAIVNAKKNAEKNGVFNAEFLRADVSDALKALADRNIKPVAVVVDPPRKGLAKDVIETIARISPARVVYVSCDCSTLARDLRLFCELGFDAKKAVAVDMFPGTRHVETVVLLSKAYETDDRRKC